MESLSALFAAMERQGIMTAKDIRTAFRIWLERLAEEKRFLKGDGSANPVALGEFFECTAHTIRQWLEMRAEPTVETVINGICCKVSLHPDEFYAQLRTINAEVKGRAEDDARKSAIEMMWFYRNMDSVERNKVRMAILSEMSQEVEAQLNEEEPSSEFAEELLVG